GTSGSLRPRGGRGRGLWRSAAREAQAAGARYSLFARLRAPSHAGSLLTGHASILFARFWIRRAAATIRALTLLLSLAALSALAGAAPAPAGPRAQAGARAVRPRL